MEKVSFDPTAPVDNFYRKAPTYKLDHPLEERDELSPSPPPPPRKTAPPPPPLKPEIRYIYKSSWHLYIVPCFVVLLSSLFFGALAFKMAVHNISMREAWWDLVMGNERIELQETTLLPLIVGPTSTTSSPISEALFNQGKRILHELRRTYMGYYKLGVQTSPCLCMHHVKFPFAQNYQVCVLYNRHADQMFGMINPRQIGGGTQTVNYSGKSVSCNRPLENTTLSSHVIIQWVQQDNEVRYLEIGGSSSLCLQMALKEFKGDAHCHY